MRKLLYSAGSPFARSVRIVLAELDLDYDKQELISALPEDEMASMTPTLQVPTFWDGDLVLWDSGTIVQYLLATYDRPLDDGPSLSPVPYRPGSEWQDRLLFSTIQTFGTAATTISQLTWTGVTVATNAHLERSARQLGTILNWLEGQLVGADSGFHGACVCMQDIFLLSHIRFVQARPIGIDLDVTEYPKINALLGRLDQRKTVRSTPILWWEPGIVGYEADGKPVFG
jgi:glutathione S-transferase